MSDEFNDEQFLIIMNLTFRINVFGSEVGMIVPIAVFKKTHNALERKVKCSQNGVLDLSQKLNY